ncbi:putative nicotinate phosphoribosyltransferase [Rickettsiales bacterium Ac37b]|nr:putative nicotinate phosphoribosyltransferase [Rickettsiales bacterium Ac37b]
MNIILNTDSYKFSHYIQYPTNTTYVSAYIEARGKTFDQILFFGVQMFLKEYLSKPLTLSDIKEAKDIVQAHGLPFYEEGFHYILEKHNGYLPIKIEALAEGAIVPMGNVLVQVENTDPACYWLTSFIETSLLRAVWYPSLVATVSWHAKQIIKEFLKNTSDNQESLRFKLHDFGARGVSSMESAGLGGVAHLVNFYGTDTVTSLLYAKKYYDEQMAGYSIPVAEHSTITSWGKENETLAYKNMLDKFGGAGRIVAVVSDSYDIWHAIDCIWGENLKEEIKNNGGTLVIRPDSGDPVKVVTQVITKLMDKFEYFTNTKGYKILPNYLRVIQGDGISLQTIKLILENMQLNGLSADNITFGMGGNLLQKVSRDMIEMVMKASAIFQDGRWKDVYKEPKTDYSKRSKKGRLALIRENGRYQTIRLDELGNKENLLMPIFQNGHILKEWNFQEIRVKAGF